MKIPTSAASIDFINTVLTKQIHYTESFPVLVGFAISQSLELPSGDDIELHYMDLEKSIVTPTLEAFTKSLPTDIFVILRITKAFYMWRVAVSRGTLMIREVDDLDDLASLKSYVPKTFENALDKAHKDKSHSAILYGISQFLNDIMPNSVGG